MSKADFISGSILEFKVPIDLGYAYCKVLDFRHITSFDGVLANVYDYIVAEPIKDIKILNDKDWLFGARRMPWLPNTQGRGAWKLKGVLISGDDNIIPDFKYCVSSNPFEIDQSKYKPWYAVRDLIKLSSRPYPYDAIKHLEDTVVSPQPAIEIRTAMEYYRIQSMDVKEYFDLSKVGDDLIYKEMINIPIYKTIPKEIRGKAVED